MPRAWTRLPKRPHAKFVVGRYYGANLCVPRGYVCRGVEEGDDSSGAFYTSGGYEISLYATTQFYLYSGKLTDLKKIEESFKKHLTRTTKRDTLKNQEAGNV